MKTKLILWLSLGLLFAGLVIAQINFTAKDVTLTTAQANALAKIGLSTYNTTDYKNVDYASRCIYKEGTFYTCINVRINSLLSDKQIKNRLTIGEKKYLETLANNIIKNSVNSTIIEIASGTTNVIGK